MKSAVGGHDLWLFQAFTDLALYLVSSNIHVSNYLLQWLFCILSIALVALGVYLQVKAKVIYLLALI